MLNAVSLRTLANKSDLDLTRDEYIDHFHKGVMSNSSNCSKGKLCGAGMVEWGIDHIWGGWSHQEVET